MPLQLREFHPFQAAGRRFVYLVPSAAVFALDDTASAVVDALDRGPRTRSQLVDELSNRFGRSELEETVSELLGARTIGEAVDGTEPLSRNLPPVPFPLTTLVLNVTNKCNLSCTYCYEYGEDRIVDTRDGEVVFEPAPVPPETPPVELAGSES